MSHTTTIQTLVLSDAKAIRSAIAELKRKGVNLDLLENAIPRAYSRNQAGMGQADMVMRLNDGSYDVGLYKREDNTFEARADFWNGDIERTLGAKPGEKDDATQAKLGRFYSTYAAHAATRKAAQDGFSVRRVDKADGSIQLVLT